MNDQYLKDALAMVDALTNEDIAKGLAEHGIFAVPVAQLDADLPPLPKPFMDLHTLAVRKAWEIQMQAYARQAAGQYVERIRHLETAYAAATSLAGDTINARNAEVAEQGARVRHLERELAERKLSGGIDTPEFVMLEAAYVKALYEYPDAPSQKRADAITAARRALIAYIDGRTAAPVQRAEAQDWRVGEFWSSANPGKKVLMLAEGAKEIESYGKHGDFIRWVDGRTAGTASDVVPEGWKRVHQTYYGVEGWRDIEEHAVDEHKSMGFEVRTMYIAAAPSTQEGANEN